MHDKEDFFIFWEGEIANLRACFFCKILSRFLVVLRYSFGTRNTSGLADSFSSFFSKISCGYD